jgi:zinc protease
MSIDPTTFNISVMPAKDVTLPEAEKALDGALAQFLKDGIDPDQFARIKTQVKASEIYSRDNTQGLAQRYGEALASGFSVQDVENWPDVLTSVTEADVMAAAKTLFQARDSVTGYAERASAAPSQASAPSLPPVAQEVTQ